jgi:hypothetical protein
MLGTHLFYEILGLPKLMVLGFPFTWVIIRCRCCEVFFRHGVTRGHADGLRVGHKDHHSWLKAKKAMCKNFGKQRCTSYLQLEAGTFCCPYHETVFYMRRYPKIYIHISYLTFTKKIYTTLLPGGTHKFTD